MYEAAAITPPSTVSKKVAGLQRNFEQMIARPWRDGDVTARRWLLAQVRHVGWKGHHRGLALH
jgi:hypothetical protein